MSTINDSEITFVIQGAVDPDRTSKSIELLKGLFPQSQIILSSWEGTDVSSIDCKNILLNEDPGGAIRFIDKKNNVNLDNINRQIVSTLSGLQQVNTKYAVKLRSDNIITSRSRANGL